MALVKHTCPQCGETVRVHPAATEVTHACPAKRLRGRPQTVAFRPVVAP